MKEIQAWTGAKELPWKDWELEEEFVRKRETFGDVVFGIRKGEKAFSDHWASHQGVH